MKRLPLIGLLTLPLFLKAQVKQQIARVDTVPGHGYEIMYVGRPYKSTIRTSDGGTESWDYYYSIRYNWPKAKIKIDSIYNLQQGWRLANVSQLRTIFSITQRIMDKNRIRIGSLEFQGIHGLYWCNNSPDGSFDDLDNVSVAGSQNNREFEVTEEHCKETVKVSTNGRDLFYKEQLLMVRKY